MATVTISLPKEVAEKIDTETREKGFATRSEFIRSLIRRYFGGEKEEIIHLSPAAEKRYAKMDEDFRTGKNVYEAKDVDDLIRQLESA